MLLNSVSDAASVPAHCIIKDVSLAVAPLDDTQTEEVLAFLSERPACTFIMASLIRDNGLESPLNRGTFYGCRGAAGRLEGVTLIGENTLLEARSCAALEAFARRTQGTPDVHMVIGEQAQVRGFWRHYAGQGQAMSRFCRQLLFELRYPVGFHQPVPGLRPATMDELGQLMAVHARMALEESGVNPLEVDPEGFGRRYARRIEQGRACVYTEDGRLVFKADVISETPEVAYLEGVYVSPEARGQGYGVRCLSQLSRHLLSRSKSTCVLVNEQNRAAHALYRKAGYQLRGLYDTIFLQRGRGGGAHPC
jgi:ribosomal protein S18 acetylase RimI-like enzyme